MTSIRRKTKAVPLTHYQVLGVAPALLLDEIHAHYRRLAIELHPDKQGGDEEKFKAVALAWGVLKNKELRKQYDAKLFLERQACSVCQGAGLRSGFKGKRYEKNVPCQNCSGAGFV